MKENNIIREDSFDEDLKIKLYFFDSEIDLSVNDDYQSFVSNICKIIKVSEEDIDMIILTYLDDDGDSITLSCKADYDIFYTQVKESLVKKISLKIKEDSRLDADECFSNFINYKEKNTENNYIINNNNFNETRDNDIINNKINNINEINNYNEEEENNIIEDLNDNKINNGIIIQENNDNNDNNYENFKLDEDYFNNNKNKLNNNNEMIFEYECSSCNQCPIFNILFYCPVCELFLCPDCEQMIKNHAHPILKIESYEELKNILDDEFEVVGNDINPNQEKKKKKFTDYIQKFIKDINNNKLKKIFKKERKIKGQ